MQENIGQKTKRSLLWNTFLPLAYEIFRFAISIIIARVLNPKDFGIMSMASIIIFYSNNLTNFGLSNALVQRKEIIEDHIHSVYVFNLIVSILLTILTIVFASDIAYFFNMPELKDVFWALSSIFILTTFYVIPVTILRRNVDFKKTVLVEICRGVIQSLVTLIMALMGFGYWSLVNGLIIGQLLGTIMMMSIVKWTPKLRVDFDSLKEIFNFASWNFIFSQVNLFNDYIDKLIIGKYIGPVSLGYYEKAFSTAFMPVQSISDRIAGVMFSSFSRSQANTEKLKEYFTKSISIISLLCFPIFTLLLLIAPYFVITLLGDKWAPAVIPLQILSIAFSFKSMISIVNALNIGTGNYMKHIKWRIFVFIITIAMCLYFVNKGINIIAIVILISYFIYFILTVRLANQYLNCSWYSFIRSVIPAFCGSVVMFIVVRLLSISVFRDISLVNLLVLTVIGVITYIVFIAIIDFKSTKFLKEEIREKIVNIKENYLYVK